MGIRVKRAFGIVLAAVFMGAFVLGCAGQYFQVRVNGFTDPELAGIEAGSSVFVTRPARAANPLLQKEIRYRLERHLRAKGMRVVSHEEADYFLNFGYGIGTGRAVTVMLPYFEPGGRVRVETHDSTGTWTYKDVQLPDTTYYVPEQRTVYDRWLTISVIDARVYRQSGKVNTLWFCEASSIGGARDIREVVKYLMAGAFEHFGLSTGRSVDMYFSAADERVTGLAP